MAGPGKCCRFNVLTVTRSAVARGVVTHRVWWDPVRRTLIHRCCMTETTLRLWYVQNSSSSQEKWPRTLPGTYLLLAFSVAGNCQRENLVKKLARDEGLTQEKNSQEVGLTQINVCSYTHIPPPPQKDTMHRLELYPIEQKRNSQPPCCFFGMSQSTSVIDTHRFSFSMIRARWVKVYMWCTFLWLEHS